MCTNQTQIFTIVKLSSYNTHVSLSLHSTVHKWRVHIYVCVTTSALSSCRHNNNNKRTKIDGIPETRENSFALTEFTRLSRNHVTTLSATKKARATFTAAERTLKR